MSRNICCGQTAPLKKPVVKFLNEECECKPEFECNRMVEPVPCRSCDLSDLPSRSKYDIADLQTERLAVAGAAEMAQQAAVQNYDFTAKVIHNTRSGMLRGLKESMQRMGERYLNVERSQQDQVDELENNIAESEKLNEIQKRLSCLLCEVDNPLSINKRALAARQKRECVEQTNDDVEHALNREIEVLCSVKQRFSQLLEVIKEVLNELCESRLCMEKDSTHKLEALAIDSYVSKLTTNSPGIDFHEDIEKQDKTNTTLDTWTDHTERLLCRSQRARRKSECLRSEAEDRIRTLFSEVMRAVDATDAAVSGRLQETQFTRDRTQSELERTESHLSDAEHQRKQLLEALDDLYRPLQLAQTRLERRTHRPCMELSLDPTMIRLQNEVVNLTDSIAQLKKRLRANEETRECLCQQRNTLLQALRIKDHALTIDRIEVQGPRQAYHMPSFITHCL